MENTQDRDGHPKRAASRRETLRPSHSRTHEISWQQRPGRGPEQAGRRPRQCPGDREGFQREVKTLGTVSYRVRPESGHGLSQCWPEAKPQQHGRHGGHGNARGRAGPQPGPASLRCP